MKAICVRQFGDPDVLVLEDLPDPTLADGEVLVEVKAAGVNPFEAYARTGNYANLPSLPYTPGVDAAGVVRRIGAGVTRVTPGARVYVAQGPGARTSGTYAQLTIATENAVFPLPDRLSFPQGAGIGVPYVTAWRALMIKAAAQAGDTVLIHGASGGVGIAAVQIARAAGLTIIGTAGTDRGLTLVREQGAQHAVNHTAADYQDDIRRLTNGRGPDIVIEMLANVNLAHDLGLVAPGGRVVIVGSRGPIEIVPRAIMGKESIVTGLTLWATPPEDLRRAHAGFAAGFANATLTPVVGTELPLADAPTAHRLVTESRAYGKIVMIP